MAGRTKIGERFSVVLDAELQAAIQTLSKETGEGVASLLRKALRCGLPFLKAGGSPDAVQLDAQTKMEVDDAVKATGCVRDRLLLEAIRLGLQEAYWKMEREKWENQIRNNPERSEAASEATRELEVLEYYRRMTNPNAFQSHMAKSKAGFYSTQLYEILDKVPAAKEWMDLRMRHWQLARFWVQIGDLTLEKLKEMVAKEEEKHTKEVAQNPTKPTPTKPPRKPAK
jgi:hypothetical protein